MHRDVAILGLGYVGLPLAREASKSGLSVLGVDINQAVVDSLNAGRSHIDDLTDSDVVAMSAAGFEATSEWKRLAEADVVVICVPTPLTEEGRPDLTAVIEAVRMTADSLRAGMTVILESTTYPGTTEEVVLPLLETSGLKAGDEFFLAFSPERIDPGRTDFGPRNTPKVVGGHTPACTKQAASFYEGFIDTVVQVKGTREAEMAKILENTYRHVNIALVNEMARFCHDLDIDLWEAIRAAATKPFGFQPFYPGPGVGGHCIPIDPNYLSYRVKAKLKHSFRFVELAQDINAGMPEYVAMRAGDILNRQSKPLRGSSVLLLGVTYKADIADQRESPAVDVARFLVAKGAQVSFHDPHVATWRVNGLELSRVKELEVALRSADLTILLQAHRTYDVDALAAQTAVLFDTRGQTSAASNIERL